MEDHIKTKMHRTKESKTDTSGMYACTLCNFSSRFTTNFRKHVRSMKHNHAEQQRVAAIAVEKNASVCKDDTTSLLEVMEMFLNHMKDEKNQQTELILTQQTEMFKILADRIGSTNTLQNSHVDVKQNIHNISTTTTTTNNKKFNLNFFLNEECKNAMNMTDFIQNIVVNMEDLEHLGEVGYTKGMSSILSRAIGTTEKTERPMHCSDPKREVIYVRKNDGWEKDANKEECERLIRHIVSKNYKTMKKWCEEHPGYTVPDSTEYDIWYRITHAMCNTDAAALKKLIHHLALETMIDK